jgi:EAL domain-containing protein (putative c-di-GMP-specific phosphodiesterase class I)
MAERLGRVDELGRVVRASIAATLAAHPDRREPIFVNVHPHELRGGGLNRPDEPLLPWASRIIIEITERAQLGQAAEVKATISALRERGFRLAVDDVGEGYAGLSWLIAVAPDVIKIDMSLVRGIEGSAMKRDVVAALVNLGRRSNAFIVAEGVETEDEARTVADLGCDLMQGYHFSRPGPPFPTVRHLRPVHRAKP